MRDERPVVEILSDIFGNLEDIVQSQIHLAKAEVAEELHGIKSAATILGVALIAGVFAAMFLLLAAMFALSLVLTNWGAALVVAAAASLISLGAVVLWARSKHRSGRVAPGPQGASRRILYGPNSRQNRRANSGRA